MYGAKVLILFSMYFLHIVEDFHLQGKLANFKQKAWWKENCPDEKYKHDWLISLISHGFSWTFMILIVPAIFLIITGQFFLSTFMIAFILNWFFHSLIDNEKANKFTLNLVQDQCIHIFQIVYSWFLLLII